MKSFEGMSSASLRAIGQALRSGQLGSPFSKLALRRVAPSCSDPAADELARLSADGMKPAHLALLVDSLADAVEARLSMGAELVWTGPETAVAHSRDTAVVLAELFASATKAIIVSTFVVHQPRVVFRALADRITQVPELKVQLFVHVGREKHDTRHESEILREFATDLRGKWPGERRPTLYYDPRSLSSDAAEKATWHAKVVVVDEETSFVTSANFTEWAQQRERRSRRVDSQRRVRTASVGAIQPIIRETQEPQTVPAV